MNAQDLLDSVKGFVTDATPASESTKFYNVCSSVASSLNLFWFIDSGTSTSSAAMIIKSVITQRLSKISDIILNAAAVGYILPNDPNKLISEINSKRQLWKPVSISKTDADNLVLTTIELSKIVDKVESGEVLFNRPKASLQISSFNVSIDGISNQSSDALSDILGYQPDGDFIKRKRALDSLSKLDFSKRKPYLLFTADVFVNGKRNGETIICWSKMRDASGYLISKRDVFANSDMQDISISNLKLEQYTKELLNDHDFNQIISFYDWLHPGDFFAYKDTSTSQNTLYSISLTALQNKAPATLSLFDVQMSNLYISPGQESDIKNVIDETIKEFNLKDENSISPYSAISQIVYGDPSYGWVISGCTTLASIRRGDENSKIRLYSFLGSKFDDIISLAKNGTLFIPNDISEIQKLFDSSIQSFGISQTILSILDGIGATFFISGKDDPNGLQIPTQESLDGSASGLSRILSAIDPESAIVDSSNLISSLTTRQNKSLKQYKPKFFQSSQKEIPDISSIVGNEKIDITTYEGISKFINVIRYIYDFYPGYLT